MIAIAGFLSASLLIINAQVASAAQVVVRKPLLTAVINGQKTINRVEIKGINFSAR